MRQGQRRLAIVLFATLALSIAMAACQKAPTVTTAAAPAPDPVSAHICQVADFGIRVLDVCKDGDLLVFLPARWGNEQIPIVAAAQFCDFRQTVVYNNGGLVCVFTGARIRAIMENERKAAQPPAKTK